MPLLNSYWFRGKLYGPGGTQDLPQGDDPDTRSFLDKIKEREQVALDTAETKIEELLSQLPAGHPYLTMFAARNAQPPQFEGTPSSNMVVPEPGMPTFPAGATVSGEQQEGSLANNDDAPIMQPKIAADPIQQASTTQPRTVAQQRAAASKETGGKSDNE